MTYCIAVSLEAGLVFASDSRTNAGIDQVSTYSKMHVFGVDGERQFVLLNSGNLATTQAVVARLRRDIDKNAETHLFNVEDLEDAAEYLGRINRQQQSKHAEEVETAGQIFAATFLFGGQIGTEPPGLYLIYPQGNFITTSEQTPFLQIGEGKYGKPILDRILMPETDLQDAARCCLVSMDSTMRSNASVGPPIELVVYERDSLVINQYRQFDADDDCLIELRRAWDSKIKEAFAELPPISGHLGPKN
jgi:putative proteasome-type protease